jgi:hypothetical protein
MVWHFVVAFLPILVGGASRAAPPRREIVLGIDVGVLNMKVSAAFPSGDRDQQVCTWFNRRLRRSALKNGLQLHTILFPSNRESRRSPAVVACDAQGRLVFGEEAMREARLHPSRAVREPLRLLGQVSSSRAVSHLGVPTSARKRHERERCIDDRFGSGDGTFLTRRSLRRARRERPCRAFSLMAFRTHLHRRRSWPFCSIMYAHEILHGPSPPCLPPPP